ncbi:hypothetical protein [Streptomyces luteireticuli]|uniref:hypothetical protein n=1 Tax=Streptomyces luteireticuli TaxID=173858 RepID=UPI003557FFDF
MADAYPSLAPFPAHAPRMARPGFGKRSAPAQAPRRKDNFAHLPPREASIAAFIDRLPEGAAIDGKSLAAQLPAYGQAACLTALRRLAEAGHLRRFTEHLKSEDGSSRWVTRTFFSRTPRDDAWWEAVRTGDVAPAPVKAPEAAAPAPAPAPERPRSRAYRLLATLGRTEPRLTLSAADCAALAPLAEPWFERGVGDDEFVRTLTCGLPPEGVHHAAGFVRRRLTDKIPPEKIAAPSRPHLLLECVVCRDPGTTEALPGGICRPCRGEAPPRPDPCRILADDVHVRVEELRSLNRRHDREAASSPAGV